jgi:hypothetical protein
MLKLLLISLLTLPYPALAQGPAKDAVCITQANEKKLDGESRTAFLKICEQQAKIGCETVADGNNLTGAERTSFVDRCVKGTAGK